MSGDNYITKLMISSIEEIKTNKVNWPGHWKLKDKIKFFRCQKENRKNIK